MGPSEAQAQRSGDIKASYTANRNVLNKGNNQGKRESVFL